MKIPPRFAKMMVPAIALTLCLGTGLLIGHIRVKNEQKLCQDKIKEANRKMAFIQKKTAEEKAEAIAALDQQYQGELNKLRDSLQHEKKLLGGELGKLKEYAQKLELRIKTSEEASDRTKKELQEQAKNNQELEHELKKITAERQVLQAELNKTTRELGQCSSNNSELCTIAEELVDKYRNKGVGAALLAKEPLIQVKKVELEQLVQEYREKIDQQKISKQ